MRAVHLLLPGLALFLSNRGHAEDTVLLAERFAPGREYHVTTRVRLNGEIAIPVDNKPPQVQKMTGEGDIDYDERVLTADGKTADARTVRQYQKISFARQTGDRPQSISLRPAVSRIVVMQRGPVKSSFS